MVDWTIAEVFIWLLDVVAGKVFNFEGGVHADFSPPKPQPDTGKSLPG
jgi:hypothetical protein